MGMLRFPNIGGDVLLAKAGADSGVIFDTNSLISLQLVGMCCAPQHLFSYCCKPMPIAGAFFYMATK